MDRSERSLSGKIEEGSPMETASELCHLPGFFFLDSSASADGPSAENGGRFSLITAGPHSVIRGNLFNEEDFARLEELYVANLLPEESTPDLCFPTAGLYGYITYEGDFVFGEHHEFLAYDHRRQRWEEKGSLSSKRISLPSPRSYRANPIHFRDELDETGFCALVGVAQEYIAAGDIYQVNLSHRFSADLPGEFDAFALYSLLRNHSPAPFAAFAKSGDLTILSSSPEQFLSISRRTIHTRPIKGTRPRYRDREKDEKSAYDLITSPKEVAELTMITDLERNDLGQICEFGTVTATELLKLERYAQVFHLVSTIEGTLRNEVSPIGAVRACFPGGSITGAPKKRAREVIE